MVDTVETAIYKMSSDTSQYVTAMDNAAAAGKRAADATEVVVVATEKVDRATRSSAAGLDRAIARLDPRTNAEQKLAKALDQVQRYEDEGIGTAQKRLQLMDLSVRRYQDQISALDRTSAATQHSTTQVGLASHELINLSRQVQDVGVSLQAGQSPFTVLVQQGTQVFDIFASSQSSVKDFFTQMTGWIGRILTPLRLLAGAVVGVGAAAVTAAMGWGSSQREIVLALSGIGRASGATVDDINRIGSEFASVTKLSRSEAREFATTLASTGKIGVEMIGPLVGIGKDVATALGVDASEAAKILAKAFSEPERGAVALNEKMGFLDATTQRQIRNLSDQNRNYEAQIVLFEGVKSSAERAAKATSTFWSTIGNFASNAWDILGQGAARATGIGFNPSVLDQIEKSRARIASLESRPSGLGVRRNITQQLDEERARLSALTAEWEKNTGAVEEARRARDSLIANTAVKAALPEVDTLDKINNLAQALANIPDNQDMLAKLGIKPEQLKEARDRMEEVRATFQTTFEQAQRQLQLESKSIGAVSPTARAEVARQQVLNSLRGVAGKELVPEQKDILAWQAYNNVLKQSAFAMSELKRERALQADQGIQSAQLEIDMIGKTVGEQYRMRAELEERQRLEQEAYRSRTVFDQAEFDRLKQKIALTSQLKQLEAERKLADDVSFDRDQVFRNDIDAQIASRQRSAGVPVDLASASAAAMRLNEQLRATKDLGLDAFKGMISDLRAGKNAMEALTNALNKIADKLIDMALNDIWSQAFGGLSGGGVMKLFGIGGAGAPTDISYAGGAGASIGADVSGALGGLYATGGYTGDAGRASVAGLVHGQEFVVNADATARHRPLLEALNDNKMPSLAMGGYMAPPMASAGAAPNVVNNIKIETPQGTTASVAQTRNSTGGSDVLVKVLLNEVKKGLANGDFDTSMARFGASPRVTRR